MASRATTTNANANAETSGALAKLLTQREGGVEEGGLGVVWGVIWGTILAVKA